MGSFLDAVFVMLVALAVVKAGTRLVQAAGILSGDLE